jgi:hypothetical protein
MTSRWWLSTIDDLEAWNAGRRRERIAQREQHADPEWRGAGPREHAQSHERQPPASGSDYTDDYGDAPPYELCPNRVVVSRGGPPPPSGTRAPTSFSWDDAAFRG